MPETSNQNIENIGTRLYKTLLDENQMTQSIDISKRSEKHEPEVNLDPEPPSSDSSESSSSDSRARKNNRKKKKKRRKHRTDESSDPSLSDDSDSSDDSHYRRKQHNNKKHREKDLMFLIFKSLTSIINVIRGVRIIARRWV